MNALAITSAMPMKAHLRIAATSAMPMKAHLRIAATFSMPMKAHHLTVSSFFRRRRNLGVQSINCCSGWRTDPSINSSADMPFVTRVAETKCNKLFGNLTAKDIELSPKANLLVRRLTHDYEYFTLLSLEEDGNLSQKNVDLYPPFPLENGFCFHCSYNGLICFENVKKREFLLWNPTTNDFKIIPIPFEPSPHVLTYCLHSGMWFDSKSEDYKVMFVVEVEDEEAECLDLSYQIELYSLKSNSWKKIPCTGIGCIGGSGVCMNGFSYCVAYRERSSTKVILSFDFSTEKISTFPLPDTDEKRQWTLVDYNGVLSVFSYSLYIEIPFELWVLMNGSWALESVFHTSGVRRPLCFWKNGELVCFKSNNNELVVFDRATGKLKILGDYGTRMNVVPFLERSFRLNQVSELEVKQEYEKEKDGQMVQVAEKDEEVIEVADGSVMEGTLVSYSSLLS